MTRRPYHGRILDAKAFSRNVWLYDMMVQRDLVDRFGTERRAAEIDAALAAEGWRAERDFNGFREQFKPVRM